MFVNVVTLLTFSFLYTRLLFSFYYYLISCPLSSAHHENICIQTGPTDNTRNVITTVSWNFFLFTFFDGWCLGYLPFFFSSPPGFVLFIAVAVLLLTHAHDGKYIGKNIWCLPDGWKRTNERTKMEDYMPFQVLCRVHHQLWVCSCVSFYAYIRHIRYLES